MSENFSAGKAEYPEYNGMTTAQLEQLLREDAASSEDGDTDRLLYITQILADRRREAVGEGKSARQAWEEFLRDYLPEEDEPVSPKTPENKRKNWLRSAAAVAVAAVVLVAGGITAAALPPQTWGIIANWTRDTFYFSRAETGGEETAPSGESELAVSLEQALAVYAPDADMLPAWIPEEYILLDVQVTDTMEQDTIIAFYSNGESMLNISVCNYVGKAPTQYERSEDLLEVRRGEKAEYYIFSNNGQICAVWSDGTYEYSISGEMPLEVLKKIIDSIEKGR